MEMLLTYRVSEATEPPREVVPRFLGKTKADNLLLNGLQIAGFSESGKLPFASSAGPANGTVSIRPLFRPWPNADYAFQQRL